MRILTRVRVLLAGSLLLLLAGPAGAASTPKPGTAAQVAQLVAASTSVTTLSPALTATLPNLEYSGVGSLYPAAGLQCATVTSCVYGDKTSKNLVVLFGDSHASMWLPAVAPAITAAKFKLVVLWIPACHIVSLEVYAESPPPLGGESMCDTWLTNEIATITALKPKLILLGERTAQIYAAPSTLFTEQQWQQGLETTIRDLHVNGAKVALFEDIVWQDQNPGPCLAANLTNVQACSVPNPNPVNPGQQVAEKKAAMATHTGYIATTQWFCTSVCSPVVGSFITHWDEGHVSARYAQYLSKVVGTALAPYLKK
jgi:hypothetical protein